MNDTAVEMRRKDISSYVYEHDDVQLEHFSKISEALNIPYETVRKDSKFLRKKEDEFYHSYKLVGLRRKALDKIKQIEKMVKKIDDEILSEEKIDPDIILKAISVKAQLIHDVYQLEHKGIGIVTMEIEDRENAKLGN